MRIALCTDLYAPQVSGVADSVAGLAATLRAHGHAVRIYAPGDTATNDGAQADTRRFPAWDLPGSSGGLSLVLPLGLEHDLRAFRPDIIHSHTFSTIGFAAARAARRLGVPLVGTDHTFPADYLHYLKLDNRLCRHGAKALAARYYNRCAEVTAPSDSLLAELRDHGFVRPHRVISNPINTTLFQPLADKAALKHKHGLSRPAVLLFGRVAVEKDLTTALAAFARVADSADLVVVGDGPARPAFEAAVADRGLTTRLHMKGVRRGAELVEMINACDAFLISSRSETQSMTTLQSMACGLPVVAVEAGGLPEYVRHGETGLLFPPGDDAAAAAALSSLLGDPGLAAQLGERGRRSIAAYTPDAIAEAFLSLYRSVGPAADAPFPLADGHPC